VAEWNFLSKIHLKTQSFLAIRWLITWILQNWLGNLFFDTELYFTYFQFFFGWRERMSPDFDIERESVRWWGIQPLKRLFFCVKWFHMMRGVKIMYFFTLKIPKNWLGTLFFGTELYFTYFQFFFGWRERMSPDFDIERESVCW